MKKSVAIAFCAVAGLAMVMSPEAFAQSKKKKQVAKAAPAAAAKAWTDCSKVDPSKRDVCIRSLPVVRGPVPLAAAGAAAAAAAAPAAPAKNAKSAAAPAKAAAPAAVATSAIPCANVDAGKRDACLSKAAAVKGPGWAAFEARTAGKKK